MNSESFSADSKTQPAAVLEEDNWEKFREVADVDVVLKGALNCLVFLR